MKRILISIITLALMALSAMAQPQGDRPQRPDGPPPGGGFPGFGGKRVSVLITNDLSGDVDGLFALAHQLMCSSSDIRGIVGTHLGGSRFTWGGNSGSSVVEQACDRAHEVLDLLGQEGTVNVVPGAETPLSSIDTPIESAGAKLIVEEAHKASPQKPLYVTVGAGLTDIASAWLMDPSISENIVVVWIGGQEYPFGHPFPPEHNHGQNLVEYNARLDLKAFQVVFNVSDLKLVQIPRDVYRQALYSMAEIESKVSGCGELGKYLDGKLRRMGGETYVLGDSPMVLISTLTTFFEPGAASSFYETTPAPYVTDEGLYDFTRAGRDITVYRTIDTRLLFGDMETKLANYASKTE